MIRSAALTRALILLGCCWILPLALQAQVTRSSPDFNVEVTRARKLGKTRAIRDILQTQARSNDKLDRLKINKPEHVRNFTNRRKFETSADALPKGVDPLLYNKVTRDGEIAINPDVLRDGVNFALSGRTPPDPNGDASDQYFVQTVNATWILVTDLQGNNVGQPFMANTIWSEVNYFSRGDPIILYDQGADRWFMTEFATQGNNLLIAVSDSNDPLGEWHAYAFGTPFFPDYPKYGIWEDALVLTTNENSTGIEYYMINRDSIIAGSDNVPIQRFTLERPVGGFFVATPVNWTGTMMPAEGTKPMVMYIEDDGWNSIDKDAVAMFEITVDWSDESNTTVEKVTIPTSPFDTDFCSTGGSGAFPCIPQPNGQGIDGVEYVIMNRMDYRNFGTHSSIVLNFTVDVTGEQDAGIRWMELRKPAGEEWSLYQEGTIGTEDGENRWMGGISIDSKGNIGIGYNKSSETTFPSLMYSGRLESDPLGQMTVVEYEIGTGGGSLNGDRFGDYSSMAVDANDVFWFTGEYVASPGNWSTKVAGFRLERAPLDIGPFGVVSPENSPELETEELSIAVRNWGMEPVTSFELGYIFDEGTPVVETVEIDPLLTDSVYVHTFDEEIVFDAYRQYSLVAFTSMENDSNRINDTCAYEIRKLTKNDAQVYAVDGVTEVICDTFLNLEVYLKNNGEDPLESVTLTATVNDELQTTVEWTGFLETGDMDIVPIMIYDLREGLNDASIESSMPNGEEDQDPTSDRIDIEDFNVTPGGSRVVLNLLTDEYPDETTWELLDSEGNVLFEDGPFDQSQTWYTWEWCLEEDSCYTFVLYDSFGDGITGPEATGDFEIFNAEGVLLARLGNPNFGDEYVADFCNEVGCTLAAQASVAHESSPGAGNGRIIMFVTGGLAPIEFSIDGGQTYQTSTVFSGLQPGEYEVLVRDGSACETSVQATVLGCDTQIMFEIMDASGPTDSTGSIVVLTEGAAGSTAYSIDGGVTYQQSNMFSGLPPDTYVILVRDSVGCTVGEVAEVSFTSSLEYTTQGQLIRVYPNPSRGDFYIEVEGLQGENWLKYQLIDGSGKTIFRREASNYSGVLKGYFTINDVPSGVYYLKFEHEAIDRLVRVIKL